MLQGLSICILKNPTKLGSAQSITSKGRTADDLLCKPLQLPISDSPPLC